MEIALLEKKAQIQEKELCIMILILKQVNTLPLLEFIMIKAYKKILMSILLFMLSSLAKFLLLQDKRLLHSLEVLMLTGMANK